MEARANLRLVGEQPGDVVWPETGELLSPTDATNRIRDLLDEVEGLTKLTKRQARENARLEKRLAGDDAAPHPRDREFRDLGERWKLATQKKSAKIGIPRMKLMKARHKDGFPISIPDDAPPEPTLELAIDGLCAFPYRVYDKRFREGRKSDLDNDLDLALKDERHVEQLARLGWKARREGWTPEGGWPS